MVVTGAAVVGGSVALRWLTLGGAIAAAASGAIVAGGLGLAGLSLMLFFFASSSWLTRWLRSGSPSVSGDSDAAGRRAGQVAANAGVAALGAAVAWTGREEAGFLLCAGALAAATADTWASEIGQRVGAATRLVTSWARVAPGEDGGVSAPGTVAGLAGAGALAAVAAIVSGRSDVWLPIAAAGFGGMWADSLAGATLERRVGWVGNDAVNWLGTLVGGALALWVA